MYTCIVDDCATSNERTRNKYCCSGTAFAHGYRSTIGDTDWHRHRWRRQLLFFVGNTNNATQPWQQQRMQFEGARTTLSLIVFEGVRSEIAFGKFIGAKKRRRRFAGECPTFGDNRNLVHFRFRVQLIPMPTSMLGSLWPRIVRRYCGEEFQWICDCINGGVSVSVLEVTRCEDESRVVTRLSHRHQTPDILRLANPRQYCRLVSIECSKVSARDRKYYRNVTFLDFPAFSCELPANLCLHIQLESWYPATKSNALLICDFAQILCLI